MERQSSASAPDWGEMEWHNEQPGPNTSAQSADKQPSGERERPSQGKSMDRHFDPQFHSDTELDRAQSGPVDDGDDPGDGDSNPPTPSGSNARHVCSDRTRMPVRVCVGCDGRVCICCHT